MNKQYRSPQHDKLQKTTRNRVEILETISSIVNGGRNMNSFKLMATMFFVSVMVLALSPAIRAQRWDKKTVVTFSAPVEIPGVGAQVLPAGTYGFRLLNSQSDRNIVQIFNKRGNHVYAT